MRTILSSFDGLTRKELVQTIAVGSTLPVVGYGFYCVMWLLAR